MKYWTKAQGTGGVWKKPEDFLVTEVLHPRLNILYKRYRTGVKKINGKYIMFLLEKRNFSTLEAIRLIKEKLSISRIGYAGLKDKNAITKQYITIDAQYIKNGIEKEKRFGDKNRYIRLTYVGKTYKKIGIGDLLGNEFTIMLRECKHPERIGDVIREIKERGIPNYFGEQRFGVENKNHLIGRLLIKRRYKDALALIGEISRCRYRNIEDMPKRKIKFFIHAYQSFIFNKVLDEYIRTGGKPFFTAIPIIGKKTTLSNSKIHKLVRKILEKEETKPFDFQLSDLRLSCKGGMRNAFIKIPKIKYFINNNTIKLQFTMPKGSYATVLLREIIK